MVDVLVFRKRLNIMYNSQTFSANSTDMQWGRTQSQDATWRVAATPAAATRRGRGPDTASPRRRQKFTASTAIDGYSGTYQMCWTTTRQVETYLTTSCFYFN